MNRRHVIFSAAFAALLVLAVTILLAYRHGGSGAPSVGESDRMVTDMAGSPVRVPAHPQRILSLCTTATDTLVTLGAADSLIAIDEFSRVVPGSDRAAIVGKGSALSRESLMALRIDLAFIWWYQDDAAALLDDLAIPTVRIRSGRAAELPATIRLIGDCLNAKNTAEPLAARLDAFLANAPTPSASAPRVFLELNGPFKTVGRDTYTNDLLTLAGLVNIAADAKGSVVLSAERLIQADPDVILLAEQPSDQAALIRRPGFSDLRAIRRGQIFALDRYWLVAGPNLPQSVQNIRAALAAHSVATAAKE